MMGDNRKWQIWVIIGLTAITMMPQYALQGWLATGGNPADLPTMAWGIDAGAWAIRAIVEAWVLVYLFSTQPENDAQSRLLAAFEIALIVLITLTLGPALYAIGNRQPIAVALDGVAYGLWAFGVASYAPLMLGAAGFAWRVENSHQPEQFRVQIVQPSEQSVNEPPGGSTLTEQAAWIIEQNPGLSTSEYERLTGASRGTVNNAKKLLNNGHQK